MSDDDYRLEKRIEKIKDSETINQETKDFLTKDYLNEVKRSGADSKKTQEIYLRRLKRILDHQNLEKKQVEKMNEEELGQLNDDIVENVQDSEYKKTAGDFIVRTKRGFWGSWKRMLQTLGLDTSEHQDYMPVNVQFSSERTETDRKKKTTAEDLPDREQVKQFLKTLKTVSSEGTALRNQALVGLLWDTGPRIGEVIEDDEIQTIRMEQVHVSNDRIHIKFKSNKNKTEQEREENDRRVEIFQCRKILQEYIEQHPKRNDPDAFLFPPGKNNQHHSDDSRFYTSTSKSPIRRKIHQTRRKAELEFKTKREPFHIFRKGMITYYVMNEVLSWEKVCERTGKDPSSTMPTYLKMAMSDINAQAAEGFGLDRDTRNDEHRMIGPPLLPIKCSSCEKENKCTKENCTSCGHTLPDAEMPDNLETEIIEEEIYQNELEKFIETNPEAIAEIITEKKQ